MTTRKIIRNFIFVLIFFLLCFPFRVQNYLDYKNYDVFSEEVETMGKQKEEDKKEEIKTVPLLFIGDVMLGRYVEVLKNKEGLDPFGDTSNFLASHITIANLEGPIPLLHKPTPMNGYTFSFASSTPEYLKNHGITAVSLSNNHSRDQGLSGYENTKKVLDKEGVGHFGGYSSNDLDYFETKLGTTTVIIFGANMISTMWKEKVIHDFVQFLRQKYPDAYLVSYIHWGNEYVLEQGEIQRNLAHKLIDEGVSLIIGSHPHVVEGIEIYKGSPIFYSLGNFIFDQYFSKETQEGYMVSFDKKENNFVFKIIPVMQERSKIMFAHEKRATKILETIMKSSSPSIKENILFGEFSLPLF